ncbi:aldose epimerase family protein, partial [Streptomyces sp. IBSBF 2435]|uniref:aldose epimerase family protein n=1 Tax=Streptomyces sp. IBSBF 2435 TaxID=2903531 RepID=UPI003FA7AC86
SGGILGHMLRIDADGFLPVSTESIPWGPEQQVAGTPFDFTSPRALGDGLRAPDPQVKAADGYDHCWVLRPPADPGVPRTAAVLHDPGSGRTMEVRTTEPGIQVYTANRLDGSLAGPDGRRYGPHDAVCLETQHLPDSPNRADYPSTVLRPGEVLRSRTEFRFPHLAGGTRRPTGGGERP